MTQYNNFNAMLQKEKNPVAREKLNEFYHHVFPGWHQELIDYDSCYGKYLQSAGVDTVLSKTNYYDSINEQCWIQEKITYSNYPTLLFEYKKKSGRPGWATSPHEKADYLLYYQPGIIYWMPFNDIRNYINCNLSYLIATSSRNTDNYNVLIPITTLEANIAIDTYNVF